MMPHDLRAFALGQAQRGALVLDRGEHENLRSGLSEGLRDPPELANRLHLDNEAPMSVLIFRELDCLRIGVEVDYVEAAHQFLGFGERAVDLEMLAAAILDGGRLASAAEAHRNRYQSGLSAAHPRATKLFEL